MPYNSLNAIVDVDLLYTALFEALPGNSVLLKTNAPVFTILAVTPSYVAHSGYTQDYLVGKGIFEAFPSNDDPSDTGETVMRNSLTAVLETKKAQHLPVQRYDLQNEDGSFNEKYWKVSNQPVFVPEGEVTYIIHSAEDITSQVVAGRLKERVKGIEQAHHIFLQAPFVIGILRGAMHTIELVNEDALRFWNKSDTIIGKPLLEAIPELKGQDVYEKINQVFHTGKLYQATQVPIISIKDGKEVVRYFDLYYKPFYDEGSNRVNGVFTISNEVTGKVLAQRKAEESEDRFRVLADQAPLMVFMTDTDASLTFCNLYWLTYTGQSADQVLGFAWKKAVYPGDIEQLLATLLKAIQANQNFSVEARIRNQDGEYRYFLFTGGPRYSSDGKLLGNIGTGVDIHERKNAVEALQKSEQNLRNTILQAPVAMAILRGPAYVIEIANDHMFELWGRSQQELLGKPIFEGLPEVRNQGYEDLLNGVYNTGECFTAWGIPVTLPRKTVLETVYINLLYEAYRETDGTISGIIAVATDVTSQISAQKRLQENEAALQKRVTERTADLEEQKAFIAKILEASMDGIYALKAVRNSTGSITDFQYLFANKNIARLLNLDVQKIIGSSMLTLIPENRSNGFFDLFCDILQSGRTFQDETHFVTQDIDSWYRYIIVALDNDTVVVSTEDITEKKQASLQIEEQRNLLDSILKNSSNGISVSRVFRNEEGEVVDALTILANEAAINYTGLPKETYLTKKATEIEPHIIGSPYYQNCIKTLKTGEPFMMEYLMESTGRWLELTVSKMDEDHLIQIFTDVSTKKEIQLQVEGYVQELKRSNQNLEEFAYAASHDLKEPIRKIQIFSDRLMTRLHDKLEQEDQMYFDRMGKATHRMNTLIDDLLLYSHVSRGAELEDRVDLDMEVKKVLEDLDLELEEKKAIINLATLPVIKGHRRQLQQLFQNLITNAIKYNRPGIAPVVSISSHKVRGQEINIHIPGDKQKAWYHLIEVKDNGIGFASMDAERIFTVFTRLHGNAEYKGTGVGLSIARKVAENHGGYLWAESEAGGGATFKILLPAE